MPTTNTEQVTKDAIPLPYVDAGSMTTKTAVTEMSEEYPTLVVKAGVIDMLEDGRFEAHPDMKEVYRVSRTDWWCRLDIQIGNARVDSGRDSTGSTAISSQIISSRRKKASER